MGLQTAILLCILIRSVLSPLPVYMWYNTGHSCLEPHNILHGLFWLVCINLASVAYLRYSSKINSLTALWIFTFIDINLHWDVYLVMAFVLFRKLLGILFWSFLMNSFSNLSHLNYILHYVFILHTYFVYILEIYIKM